MPYEHLTWSALQTLAHQRVGTSSFYTTTEMAVYLTEALRVWNLMTGHFRGTAAITTTANTIFYGTTLHTQDITQQKVMDDMQYHLLETPNSGASLDSDMWTVGEWVDYLNSRLALFVAETKLVLSRTTFSSVIDQTQYDLGTSVSTDLLEVHRLAWLDSSGVSHALREGSVYDYDLSLPTWTTAGASQEPEVYVRLGRPQLKVEILPAPSAAGTFDVLYTKRPAQLPQTPDTTVVGIPNDFVPFVKWGALSDLLSKEGQANDPLRAQYAEARFQEGILLARDLLRNHMHLRAEFAGNPLDKETIFSLDYGADGWQDDSSTPVDWFPVGATQLGLHPAHLAGSGTIDVDGLISATIPSSGGAFPDIPHSDIPRILDYVHHLATFKNGGQEFQNALGLFQNFQSFAGSARLRQDLAANYERYLGGDSSEDNLKDAS